MQVEGSVALYIDEDDERKMPARRRKVNALPAPNESAARAVTGDSNNAISCVKSCIRDYLLMTLSDQVKRNIPAIVFLAIIIVCC
jgi:hypothetical protein